MMEVTLSHASKRKAVQRLERTAALRARMKPLQSRIPTDETAPCLPQWPHPWLNPEYNFGRDPKIVWEEFLRLKK